MENLRPGRELDTRVAEAMGIPIYEYDQHQGDHSWLSDEANYPYITDGASLILWLEPDKDGQPWLPSSDIAAAWIAWEWLEESSPWVRVSLQRDDDNRPTVYRHVFGDSRIRVATGESYPHAIALAVLVALKESTKGAEL